jgi:hypothetical protein
MESPHPPPRPRGARADAETPDGIYLIKNVSRLHATYQVRLLAFAARDRGKQLVLVVPPSCQFERGLRELMELRPDAIRREDLP